MIIGFQMSRCFDVNIETSHQQHSVTWISPILSPGQAGLGRGTADGGI
jgi:hypothetical protein